MIGFGLTLLCLCGAAAERQEEVRLPRSLWAQDPPPKPAQDKPRPPATSQEKRQGGIL